MLTRRVAAHTLLAICCAIAWGTVTLAASTPGIAAPTPQPTGGAGCDPTTNPWCHVDGGKGGGAGGGGSGGDNGCTWNGQPIACTDPDFGYYVGGGCYWKAIVPPPVAAPPQGKDPATGAWGVRTCYTSPGSSVVQQAYFWMDDPPGGPTPAALAQRALAKLHLLGAQIGITPNPGGSGAVGLPVWLWTAVTPGTWGPQAASASAGGLTVTITARAQRIVWTMGDGHTRVCDNPGTPYEDRFGNSMSPTCGHRYEVPSATSANPNGRYTVTATTYWTVTWSGGGQSGVLNPTSQSQASVRIGEIPVVAR